MYFFEEHTVAEIAEKLEMKPQKVSDCLHYAKRLLKKKMKPDVHKYLSGATEM